MRKFLSTIFGVDVAGPPDVKADLKRLNSLRPRLGDQAVSYVLTGENGSVLSTLANVDAAGVLELVNHYSPSRETIGRQIFLASKVESFEVAARYAEVLAACSKQGGTGLIGSKHVPLALRIFFTQASLGMIDNRHSYPHTFLPANKLALTPDFSIKLCESLGGTVADFFDLLFHKDSSWQQNDVGHLIEVFDFTNHVSANTKALSDVAHRIGAHGRVGLVKQLADWGLATSPNYIDLMFELCADTAKSVRAEAKSVLLGADVTLIEKHAEKHLKDRNAAKRTAMVELLTAVKTERALDILTTHLKIEKTARIKALIENTVSLDAVSQRSPDESDDFESYLALDGKRVHIPGYKPLETGKGAALDKGDLKELEAHIVKENEEVKARNLAHSKRGERYREPDVPVKFAKQALAVFNGDEAAITPKKHGSFARLINHTLKDKWTLDALCKLPQDRAVTVAMLLSGGCEYALSQYAYDAGSVYLSDYILGGNGDFRVLDERNAEIGGEFTYGNWNNRKTRKAARGDWLREELSREYYYLDPNDIPKEVFWPHLAENFTLLDEAFGLRQAREPAPKRTRAIMYLQLLPATPQRYYGPLLEVATGTTKTGRAEARKMLTGAPGLEKRLVDLLDDTRQDVRAGAAEWIADLGIKSAVKTIKIRLKKEKSDLARAALLTALSKLGVDLEDYVGPKALIAEAEKVLKKARFDKLDWLIKGHLPVLSFKGGKKVAPDILKAWIYLAFKLKQPGGNALFDIYLSQLKPEDAVTFSTWIFNSWINFDTVRPTEEDANAYAKANAAATYKSWAKWDKTMTEDKAFKMLYNEFRSNYKNSGAATKGVLALAKETPSDLASAQVRQYLKAHGARTSQASSLLEVLAAKGDPASLQVVIAAGTRLKQKGVQAFATGLVEKIAQERDWTLNELADRTIPSAGMNDDGILELPCGVDHKKYVAIMDDDFKLILKNSDGKIVKGLPAGDDDVTKASKKQLTASRRELKQVISMQAERLYEALCAERDWSVEDWLRDFRGHPFMKRLTEKVVWLGMDKDDNFVGCFRPTAEGDFTNADDEAVEPASFAKLRLAHGALLDPTEKAKWEAHLADYEVDLLFAQFGRPLLLADGNLQAATRIEERMGWVTDTFTVRGVASKLGYERGEAMDGGYFNEYYKSFKGAGLRAVIEFSGNCLPEENVAAAIFHLEFQKIGENGRVGRAVKLQEVPPVLLSECWNDYHDMAAKGSFDAGWEKRMPWM